MEEKQKTSSFFIAPEPEIPVDAIVFGVEKRIENERMRKARYQFIFGLVSLPLSLIFSVPILKFLTAEIVSSGFFEYVKLIFSDISGILPHWQDAALVLAESFPGFSMILFLFLLSFFFLSLRSIFMGKGRPVFRGRFT